MRPAKVVVRSRSRACSECYVEGDKWNANHDGIGGSGSVSSLSAYEGERVLLVSVQGKPLLVAGRSRVGFGPPE